MLDDFENNEFSAGDENGREGRPTFAETTAAIARHRKEAERSNFLHGLALAVAGILLVAAFTFLCRYVLQWREARERERLELARELKEADQAQHLVPSTDGSRRWAVTELLVNTPGIANQIATDRTSQIPSAIETGGNLGMRSLEDSLATLLRRGCITERAALAITRNPETLRRRLYAE